MVSQVRIQGEDQKMHLIFSQQTFTHFFFAFAFVIQKGTLTNHVDPQKGGEANFTSCMEGLSSWWLVCILTILLAKADGKLIV